MIEANNIGVVELIEGTHFVDQVGLVLCVGVSEAFDGDLAAGQFVVGKEHIAVPAASETPDNAILLVQFFADEVNVHGKLPLLLIGIRAQTVFDVVVDDEIEFFIAKPVVAGKSSVDVIGN